MTQPDKVIISLAKILLIFLAIFIGLLFLPWTQNIRAKGAVTALRPEQRPQSLHSVISGKIEKWYVKEGDFVSKGDTLIFLSEVKDEYMDPLLLERIANQIEAKEYSRNSYSEKIESLNEQISALKKVRALKRKQNKNKIQQAELKIASDSIDYEAEKVNNQIARRQLDRMQQLHDQGLKSLTDLETKKMKLQETVAKMISAENKLLASRNELLNTQIELTNTENEYQEKISKATSDLYASYSEMYNTDNDLAKLKNQESNYAVRTGYYYITAPQNGFVTRATQTGIGEVIQQGTEIATIMPADYNLAVEIYVDALDIPLLDKDQKVRFVFDGWPYIVFSGWPQLSIGSFGGYVVAIDNFASANGKFRVLVAPDEEEERWPAQLKIGSGANAIILLKNVPIWYELWRNINGFPPDFYRDQNTSKTNERNK